MSFINRVITSLFTSNGNKDLQAYFRSEYPNDYHFAYTRFLETKKLHG